MHYLDIRYGEIIFLKKVPRKKETHYVILDKLPKTKLEIRTNDLKLSTDNIWCGWVNKKEFSAEHICIQVPVEFEKQAVAYAIQMGRTDYF